MNPRDATIRAMEQVSGPVIAIGLVLSAVFVPCAFITGIVGQFFRQFALTIATSTIISAFNSLTLSPALAALLLRPRDDRRGRRNVLPTLAYALIGGLAGWEMIAPWAARRFAEHYPWIAEAVREGSESSLEPSARGVLASVAAGAILGLLISWPMNRFLSWFFRLFNDAFKYSTGLYGKLVGGMIRVSFLVILVYGGLLGLTYWGFVTTPAGFIPSQDMGYLLINVQLPDSIADERTRELMTKLETIAKTEIPGVKHTQAMAGQSMLLSANGSNFGSMFIILDSFEKRPSPVVDRFFAWYGDTINNLDERLQSFDLTMIRRVFGARPGSPPTWAGRLFNDAARTIFDRMTETALEGRVKRALTRTVPAKKGPPAVEIRGEATVRRWLNQPKKPSLYGEAIAAMVRKRFEKAIDDREIEGAILTVLGPPPVRGVGRAGGFKIMIEDRGDNGPAALQGVTENLNDLCKDQPGLVGMTSVFRANVPQLYVDVDRASCLSKDVPIQNLFDTLRIYLGSLYVNDFNKFGRTWQVIVQAAARFRNNYEDVRNLKVRNTLGSMVPLGTLANIRQINGPLVLTRYNMYPAAPLNGAAAPGVSSGEAIRIVESLASDPHYGLPSSVAFEWTELAYLELQAGNTAMIVFGFAVMMVFLVLAAQYESWSMPMAVILVVPLCLLSAIVGVKVSYQDINIFTQIGFVVLVGLASKNAILIVEFAKMRRDEGASRTEAALDACTLRLRPIVMTSLAFILGVVPLILSAGAGAEMRRTLGITVFAGMLGVTLFGIVLTPVFFVVIDWLGSTRLLNSGPTRKVSKAVLWALMLLIFWPAVLIRALIPRRMRDRTVLAPSSANGADGSDHSPSPPGKLAVDGSNGHAEADPERKHDTVTP